MKSPAYAGRAINPDTGRPIVGKSEMTTVPFDERVFVLNDLRIGFDELICDNKDDKEICEVIRELEVNHTFRTGGAFAEMTLKRIK